MSDMGKGRSAPRPLVGHHFSSLLQCIHRAWCDFFLSADQQSPPPPYLLALQKEGLAHEQAIYKALYPSAIRIPTRLSAEKRLEMTLAALANRAPVVLQAYLRHGNHVGIADVLELEVDHVHEAFVYQVGELKRATSLATSHVLQAAWYAELLQDLAIPVSPHAFFILGDRRRHVVDLACVAEVFATCKQQLTALQCEDARPGPHLCRACPSCPWRGVCMPELVASQHLSLIPGISRGQVRLLHQAGIQRWSQIDGASDEVLGAAGLDSSMAPRLSRVCASLKARKAVCRYGLRSSLGHLTAVSFDYSVLSASSMPKPTVLWYQTPAGPQHRSLSQASGLEPLAEPTGFVVYGGADKESLLRVARDAGITCPECVDVSELIESAVHAPLPGLELNDVRGYVNPALPEITTGRDRVVALREVVGWLMAGTAVA